jgi:hypothetical protein
MVFPLGVPTLAFGKNTFELPKPAGKRPTEPVQAWEQLTKRCRPEVHFANRPDNAAADLRNEHRHKRRAMNIDAVIVRDDQVTELPKVNGNAAGQRYLLGLTAALRNQSSTGLGSFGASM